MRIILLSFLFTTSVFANCIPQYNQELAELIEIQSEDNSVFGTAYESAMFGSLAYGIGATAGAGPALASTVVGAGSYEVTEIKKRQYKVADLSKSLNLLQNAEAGEGSQLDALMGELIQLNREGLKQDIIARIRRNNAEYMYCNSETLNTYKQIKQSLLE